MNSNPDIKSSPIRVLVLEDNRDDADLIVRRLSLAGLQIESDQVSSDREFMDRLGSGRYDLILCDFSLPGWNGLEALRWVRQTGHDIPFIYVSGTLGEEVAVECIRQGATDYVLKNNLARLPHAVRRALDEAELRRSKARIEHEKRQSEAQYRLLFEANPEPMWVVDRNTLAFLAVNSSAVIHYGYTREEFLRMTVLDILVQQDIPEVLQSVLQRRHLHRSPTTENQRHRKKDGTVVEVEVSRNGADFSGVEAILVLARDITELRRNERRLRESEERFSKAFSSSPAAITISTLDEGRYVEVNDAFLRLINRAREEIIGHTSIELNVWENSEDRSAFFTELDRHRRVSLFETTFQAKSYGKRAVRISAELIKLREEVCILAITDDITEIKGLEEQFRQAQKMEAVGRLAGGIAHDFNNMLGVIIGYCDLGGERQEIELVRGDIQQIKRAAERSAKLTGQLLSFSRQQVIRPSVLNLNFVIRDVLQMVTRVIGADIELRFRSAPSIGNINADLGQVEQMIMNLVVNARDAMPSGGKLIIAAADTLVDDGVRRQYPNVPPGFYVMLSLTDTGIGMDFETLSKIFEPFFTTKAVGKGTGLGLSMVYGAMQQAGGHIVAESEKGAGTTFRLFFPRIEENLQAVPSPRTDPTKLSGSETVLLVEDDDALRELTVQLLKREGYTVLAAADAQAAIAEALKFPTRIDLLLTDMVLPGMNGRELANRILESRLGTKILYVSGYSWSAIDNKVPLDPNLRIVSKPFSKEELLRQVRLLLDDNDDR